MIATYFALTQCSLLLNNLRKLLRLETLVKTCCSFALLFKPIVGGIILAHCKWSPWEMLCYVTTNSLIVNSFQHGFLHHIRLPNLVIMVVSSLYLRVLWRRVMLLLNFQEIVEWMNELPLIVLVPWLVLVVAKSSVMESVLLYNCCCGYVKLQNLFIPIPCSFFQ